MDLFVFWLGAILAEFILDEAFYGSKFTTLNIRRLNVFASAKGLNRKNLAKR